MPLRHASMQHQLHQNGVRLHAAMMARVQSHGESGPPSEDELELMEERRKLKAERDERHSHENDPKAHGLKIVRTHHAEAKAKDAKAAKKEKEAKAAAKKAKPHMTRTEKHAVKAAALDAAKKAAHAARQKAATKS